MSPYYWIIFTLAVLVKSTVILGTMMLLVPWLLWAERKILGRIQLRPGPTHVGPYGLLQPIADGVKMLFKEDITPRESFKPLFLLAPLLVATTAMFSFAVIPFGDWTISLSGLHPGLAEFPIGYITDLDLALLYILAMSSLAVYGVAWGGWAGGSKYSLIGGLRSTAQMISYELTLGLSFLAIVMINQTLSLVEIVQYQATHGWNIFFQPLTMIIFLVTMFAETNRLPFDLPEAEQELTGGYHTEHSGMRFGLFFLGEYLHMLVASSLATIIFFGGWLPPFGDLAIWSFIESIPVIGALMPLFWFASKASVFLFLYIWVRGTFPRLRYDQLMKLGWKVLLEVGFVNLFAAAFMRAIWPDPSWQWIAIQWIILVPSFVLLTKLLFPINDPTESVELR